MTDSGAMLTQKARIHRKRNYIRRVFATSQRDTPTAASSHLLPCRSIRHLRFSETGGYLTQIGTERTGYVAALRTIRQIRAGKLLSLTAINARTRPSAGLLQVT